jgi:hypothetical protein
MIVINTQPMYKIQYQAGQGKVEVLSVLVKEGENWVLLKDPTIENTLVSKFVRKDHYNRTSNSIGYGQIVVTENMKYVTGNFEVPKINQSTHQSINPQ